MIMDVIPIDDIAEEYMGLTEEQKSAVTRLVRSEACISMCASDVKGKDLSIDWNASQGMAIHLILGMLSVGKQAYGEVWLNELKTKLSQLK